MHLPRSSRPDHPLDSQGSGNTLRIMWFSFRSTRELLRSYGLLQGPVTQLRPGYLLTRHNHFPDPLIFYRHAIQQVRFSPYYSAIAPIAVIAKPQSGRLGSAYVWPLTFR